MRMVGQGLSRLASSSSPKSHSNCVAIGKPWHKSTWMKACPYLPRATWRARVDSLKP